MSRKTVWIAWLDESIVGVYLDHELAKQSISDDELLMPVPVLDKTFADMARAYNNRSNKWQRRKSK